VAPGTAKPWKQEKTRDLTGDGDVDAVTTAKQSSQPMKSQQTTSLCRNQSIQTDVLSVKKQIGYYVGNKRSIIMKALILAIGLLTAGVAVANCVTNTYFINGRMVMCTTCCVGSHCTTNCF
jgi:hypothetical protein